MCVCGCTGGCERGVRVHIRMTVCTGCAPGCVFMCVCVCGGGCWEVYSLTLLSLCVHACTHIALHVCTCIELDARQAPQWRVVKWWGSSQHKASCGLINPNPQVDNM